MFNPSNNRARTIFEALKSKKVWPLKHGHLLDAVAQSHGFKNWHILSAANQDTEPFKAEAAYIGDSLRFCRSEKDFTLTEVEKILKKRQDSIEGLKVQISYENRTYIGISHLNARSWHWTKLEGIEIGTKKLTKAVQLLNAVVVSAASKDEISKALVETDDVLREFDESSVDIEASEEDHQTLSMCAMLQMLKKFPAKTQEQTQAVNEAKKASAEFDQEALKIFIRDVYPILKDAHEAPMPSALIALDEMIVIIKNNPEYKEALITIQEARKHIIMLLRPTTHADLIQGIEFFEDECTHVLEEFDKREKKLGSLDLIKLRISQEDPDPDLLRFTWAAGAFAAYSLTEKILENCKKA